MRHGDFVWNDDGVPPGRVEILVDLPSQTLHAFRSGHEIGRTVILYGTDEDPTPLGTFTITEKDADHESNIYDAVMPFMMRLTNDGIAIHGAVVEYGKASRGCVGVPDEFAALLFAQARIGDRVRIVGNPTNGAVSTGP
jgi:lipoprotein-anchoring transpeptidase ErfK/SrfK